MHFKVLFIIIGIIIQCHNNYRASNSNTQNKIHYCNKSFYGIVNTVIITYFLLSNHNYYDIITHSNSIPTNHPGFTVVGRYAIVMCLYTQQFEIIRQVEGAW